MKCQNSGKYDEKLAFTKELTCNEQAINNITHSLSLVAQRCTLKISNLFYGEPTGEFSAWTPHTFSFIISFLYEIKFISGNWTRWSELDKVWYGTQMNIWFNEKSYSTGVKKQPRQRKQHLTLLTFTSTIIPIINIYLVVFHFFFLKTP